jgi:activator of HSP90 ATPase
MERIEMSCELAAGPALVYRAWLTTEGHSAMTGAPALFEEGGRRYTAWDGYISAEILELEEGARILQSWRTTDFKEGEADSLLELSFEPKGEGTIMTLRHSGLPEGSSGDYQQGWLEYYFEPMKAYFAR